MNSNPHHNRRQTNIIGCTGTQATPFSYTSSQHSTTNKSQPKAQTSQVTQVLQQHQRTTSNLTTTSSTVSSQKNTNFQSKNSNMTGSTKSNNTTSLKPQQKTPINVHKQPLNSQKGQVVQLSSPRNASTGSQSDICQQKMVAKQQPNKQKSSSLLSQKENQQPQVKVEVINLHDDLPQPSQNKIRGNFNNMQLQKKEADEFSFAAEHIEDEPSIHIRSLTEFQNILSNIIYFEFKFLSIERPTLRKEREFEYKGLQTGSDGGGIVPINVIYETFEEDQQQTYNNFIQNNANISKLVLNMTQMQDETIQEPSAFFNEHNDVSALHKCQLIEMYKLPQKPHSSGQIQSKNNGDCYTKLNQLIQKVKQDVSQSIIMNQSKNYMIKTSGQNSRIYAGGIKQTDITNESAFPNTTYEELHCTMNRYNNYGQQNNNQVLDETNSQFLFNNNNNTTLGNTTLINNQPAPQQTSDLHKLHLLQTLQSLQYIKSVEPPTQAEINKKAIKLPEPRVPFQQKKTIIFDLDETLIHCIDDLESEIPDAILNITFPNGEIVQAGINVRPYAIECLKEANKKYQVAVFTASHKFYADVVLDFLDPTGELIHYRMYRDSCFQTEDGVYIKDLRIIKNRELKDMVIVDNAVYSFGFQLDNGIPIIPFYNNKEDEELLHLINYISTLAFFNDLREQNAKAFQLKELENADITDYLEYFFGEQKNQEATNELDDSQAIKEEEHECSEITSQQQNPHADTSEMINNNAPLETTSELDQEEIQKCKKRLDFIELSSQLTTPEGHGFTELSTPACLQSQTHSQNNSFIVKSQKNQKGQQTKGKQNSEERKYINGAGTGCSNEGGINTRLFINQ